MNSEKDLLHSKKDPLLSSSLGGIHDFVQHDVIALEGGDIKVNSVEERVKMQEKLLKQKQKRPHSFYRDLIFSLIGVRLDEHRARSDWQAILEHKYFMSEKLKRNVGIRVAALDYYTNIKRHLQQTMVVDADILADTVEQSITDGLTGAYNRRYFDANMLHYFNRGQLNGEIFCLLLLDVDHFKIYNDLNGHVAGDLVLIEIVRILHAVSRPEDIVARYGGEEFTVIFPYLKLSKAIHVAESIGMAVKDYRFPNEDGMPGGNLTISGGITVFEKELKDISEMIEQADNALYRAKREGRNRIICFKEIQ
jgi:diguanylate cyclase (GGDEF)-like protein